MPDSLSEWVDVGSADDLARAELSVVRAGGRHFALSFREGVFGAVSNACNHAGGPLGKGTLDGDLITCPWHGWKYHRCNGMGEAGSESDWVPSYPVRVENGRVLLDIAAGTPRHKEPHPPHPLARPIERAPGPLRLAGIGTTIMDASAPRFSGSDFVLGHAMAAAKAGGAETRVLHLNDLKFRACEGYYSKAAQACTWPCSITQMDSADQMDQVYEALVHWADAVIVATPIRWGAPSSLYFKMAERLNCVQNAITIHNRVLIRNKVAGFIIIGGQDNIQAVAGQMLGFFAELGFLFPQFPYIAHSRGWTHEDMERNVEVIRHSVELKEAAGALAGRCLDLAGQMVREREAPASITRGGRKAHPLDTSSRRPASTAEDS